MIDIFRSLKSLLKINRIHIDNGIFRLHYSLTVIMLLSFCVVITTKQYVGEPIDCVKNEGVSQNVINTYCWIHTTYTVPKSIGRGVSGVDYIHPGIDATQNKADWKYHKYYQWVCFVLFFQATLFYIPRWLWKNWEGNRVQGLMMDLDVCLCPESEKKSKKKMLCEYLIMSKGYHDWYAMRYFFCEVLALANVLGQMFMLDRFFSGEFLHYGLEVIRFYQLDQEERFDPMIRIFPKVTKCRFFKYGPSGNFESQDALCVLPLNVINEKIYIFIWFWFLFLAVITAIQILFHLIIIACPPVRVYVFHVRFTHISLDSVHTIVRKMNIGDWFLLYLLGNNIDSLVFKELINELANHQEGTGKEREAMV